MRIPMPAIAFVLAAVLSPCPVAPALAASFTCAKASLPVEIAICQDATLGRLDEKMASLYYAMSEEDRAADRARHTLFLRLRNKCGADVDCIASLYYQRIGQIESDYR